MSVIDDLLSLLAPHECLGCGAEGALLCHSCSQQLKLPPPRCYRCHRLSPNNRTCEHCRSSSHLYAVHTRTIYRGFAKDLVWRLKFTGAQSAAAEMAGLMMQLSRTAAHGVLMPVPTATQRVRSRGYDQAVLLTKQLSRLTGLPWLHGVRRISQAHQVGAGRQQRLRQLQAAFVVSNPATVRGAHIILVDDVVTTGATLEATAAALRSAGAQRVEAIVFAQA